MALSCAEYAHFCVRIRWSESWLLLKGLTPGILEYRANALPLGVSFVMGDSASTCSQTSLQFPFLELGGEGTAIERGPMNEDGIGFA